MINQSNRYDDDGGVDPRCAISFNILVACFLLNRAPSLPFLCEIDLA